MVKDAISSLLQKISLERRSTLWRFESTESIIITQFQTLFDRMAAVNTHTHTREMRRKSSYYLDKSFPRGNETTGWLTRTHGEIAETSSSAVLYAVQQQRLSCWLLYLSL